ncbi:hypothetical protein [Synechococcus phage DSL-LC02]|nr:hypothetical protein [Synechococcus phage DSL-LC02]
MTQLEYYVAHVFPTGFQSIRSTFRIWCDLMTSNYKDYTLLHEDDPFTECKEWFWVSLGEDNVYPKAFLEHLQQMVDDVESGKIKTYPMPEDFFGRIVGDVELDDE